MAKGINSTSRCIISLGEHISDINGPVGFHGLTVHEIVHGMLTQCPLWNHNSQVIKPNGRHNFSKNVLFSTVEINRYFNVLLVIVICTI